MRGDADAASFDRAARFQNRRQTSQTRRPRLLGVRRSARSSIVESLYRNGSAEEPVVFFQARDEILHRRALHRGRLSRVRARDARLTARNSRNECGTRAAHPDDGHRRAQFEPFQRSVDRALREFAATRQDLNMQKALTVKRIVVSINQFSANITKGG